MITIKSPAEIAIMQKASAILVKAFQAVTPFIKSGVTTAKLDHIIHKTIENHGAVPSFLGYGGFPAASCISVNDTLIHGIPSETEILSDGDLVSIDIGVYYEGMHVDAARTFGIHLSTQAKHLMDTARESFFAALAFCKEGYRIGDISHAVEMRVRREGYGVVETFTGHGVGRDLHEDPAIPNFGKPGRGPRLRSGMTLAIEPMITLGSAGVHILEDGWTVKTVDGQLAAHYENTVLITAGEPLVLTMSDEADNE